MLLAAILAAAVLRRRWLPEAAVAVPAAVIVIVTGALPLTAARAESQRLLPVVGFLAAVLVLGQLCESEGLFTAAGARLAKASHHRPVRLLTGTFALASVTTAVLSLDTTVVLLTPVVHETAFGGALALAGAGPPGDLGGRHRRGRRDPVLLFVLGLGLVVRALVGNGLGSAIARGLPHGSSLPALLAIAAAVANLVNNLPAVLVLLTAITGIGTSPAHLAGPVLAVLIGVNIGPNLTYAGSLATLLWRRLLAERDHEVELGEFTRLGLATVPLGLAAATAALWCAVRLTGHG